MANEIVQNANAALTAALQRIIVEEARAGVTILEYFQLVDIENEPTLAYKTPKHPSTANAGAITDGTAIANTALVPTSLTGTAAGVGLKSIVTDFSTKGSVLSFDEAAKNFARALANKLDVDTTNLLGGFSGTAGTSGAPATIANFISAMYTLENNNEAKGPVVAGLHSIQMSHLRNDIVASGGTVFANPSQAPLDGFLNLMTAGPNPNHKGTLFNVPVILCTNAPTANAGVDRAGAIFRVDRALQFIKKWGATVERRREPDYVGDMLAVHMCYNALEIVDGAGSSIITSAT